MLWECGECGAMEGSDGTKVQVVCHHCGKPLCQTHGMRIVDDAFSGGDAPTGRQAYHCDECKRANHPRAVILGEPATA
jgi:hypothetical protein